MKAIELLKILEEKAPPVPKLRPLEVYFEYDIYERSEDADGNTIGMELDTESQKYGIDEFENIFDLAIRNFHRSPYRKGEFFYSSEYEEYADYEDVLFNFAFSKQSGFTKNEIKYLEYLFSLNNVEEIKKLRDKYTIKLTTKPKVDID